LGSAGPYTARDDKDEFISKFNMMR
jgi:hypothetical protein